MRATKIHELLGQAISAFPERTTITPDAYERLFAATKIETSTRVIEDFANRVEAETHSEHKGENAFLRQMLAFSYAGHKLYHDDGELQDNRMLPHIDFKRDPVPLIQAKMAARAETAMAELCAKAGGPL